MTTHKIWDIVSTKWLVTFPARKTTKELGLKKWDLLVSHEGKWFQKWEVVELIGDDRVKTPYVSNWIKSWFVDIFNISPLRDLSKKYKLSVLDFMCWVARMYWLPTVAERLKVFERTNKKINQ